MMGEEISWGEYFETFTVVRPINLFGGGEGFPGGNILTPTPVS